MGKNFVFGCILVFFFIFSHPHQLHSSQAPTLSKNIPFFEQGCVVVGAGGKVREITRSPSSKPQQYITPKFCSPNLFVCLGGAMRVNIAPPQQTNKLGPKNCIILLNRPEALD